MSRHKSYSLIALLAGVALFGLADVSYAQTNTAGIAASVAGSVLSGTFDVVGTILSPIGYAIMQLTSYIAMLGGVVLNASIYYTVILMSANFGKMPAIGEAWGVIRDVANMGFIFVLLYASIMSIIGRESPARGLIVKMVIAAILINFSLFFTKIIIDISNLLALTFYKALVPAGSLTSENFLNAGLSNAMIQALKVSSLWETPNLIGANLFITTILASVVLLITAFVFFAVAIMFITRYIVLIFVLILSPIAFVSQVLPGLDSIAKQWRSALVSQATFAPIYFLLTWVTIKMVTSISDVAFGNKSGFGTAFTASGSSSFDQGIASTLVNFAVIIGFLIVSLIVAKSAAGKSDMGINKWLTATAGGATLGMAGRLGRGSIGRVGQAVADSETLKKAAPTSRLARLSLAAGQKTAKSTFDARGSSLYESVSGATGVSMGKASGKGGYSQLKKDKVDEEKKISDSFKPSDLAVSKVEKDLEKVKAGDAEVLGRMQGERVGDRDQLQKTLDKLDEERLDAVSKGAPKEKVAEIDAKITEARNKFNKTADVTTYAQSKADEIRNAGKERKIEYANNMEKGKRFLGFSGERVGFIGKISKETKEAALEIRKSMKQKSTAQQIEEAITKQAEDIAKKQQTPPAPSTPPPATGPTTP